DGTAQSDVAMQLGIAWAKQFEAMLVGLAITDLPRMKRAATVPVGSPVDEQKEYRTLLHKARVRARNSLEQFALNCAEQQVVCKVLEDEAEPTLSCLPEAQRYDVIMLGKSTRFEYPAQYWPDEILERILKSGSRPIVLTPPKLPPGNNVVVAYDGS